MKSKPEKDNLVLLQSMANSIIGLYGLIEIIYASQMFGYPGSLVNNLAYIETNVETLVVLRRDVTDSRILNSLRRIIYITRRILANDSKMKLWVENYTGRPMSEIRKSTKLSVQLQDHEGRFMGDASPPGWTKEEHYAAYLATSLQIIGDLVKEINVVFIVMSNLSNGIVMNWAEEQTSKGRFSFLN